MKKAKDIFLLTFFLLGLLGCSVTPKMITPLPDNIELQEYTEISINIKDLVVSGYSYKATSLFASNLTESLRGLGYNVTDNARLSLDITITKAKKGSKFLGWTIGLIIPSTTATLQFIALFKDAGIEIASFEGGDIYGQHAVMHNSYDKVQIWMVGESVNQILMFIQNGRI